jgi:hypothetical protein
MASPLVARQRFVKTPTEVRNVRVAVKDVMNTGATATGTPTAVASPTGLTTSSVAVSGGALTIDDTSYAAGEVITFVVSGGTSGTVYEVLLTFTTSDSETLTRYVYISVETPSSSSGEATSGGDFDVLRRRVGDYLGKSMDPDDWSQNDFDRVSDIIDAGYRQFLHPPVLPGSSMAHEWSFLRPITSMVLWGDVTGTSSGVPSYSASTGLSTITATASKFYETMVGKTFTFDTSENEYTVAEYTSATVIKVTGDASGETSGDTFSVTADGDYQMVDGFGGLDGDLYFDESNDAFLPLRHTSEGNVLAARQRESGVVSPTSKPVMAAIVPINSTSANEGQRWKIMVWPIPTGGDLLTISFKYHALQNALSLTRPYALGGAAHFETLLASCLAVAEQFLNDTAGLMTNRWYERLSASVSFDRTRNLPSTYGYNADRSTMPYIYERRRRDSRVSFNGIFY